MSADRNGIILPITFLIVVLVLWQVGPALFDVPVYVFPQPSKICLAVWEVRAIAANHLLVTTIEAIVGGVLGSAVGFLIGVWMAESSIVRRMILPYVVGSNAIPVVAIAPVVVLWFGHGLWSKSVVAAFLCFFPLAVNTFRGLTEYEPIYANMFRVYGATSFQFFRKFKLRNAAPFVFSGMRLSATYSVIGAVVAEFIGSDSGLGFGMLQATYNLNTPRLYGYLVISCALGVAMYGAVFLVERMLFSRSSVTLSRENVAGE